MALQIVTLVDRITKSITKCDCKQLSEDFTEFSGLVKRLTPSITQHTLPVLITPYLVLHSKKEAYKHFNEELRIQFFNVLNDVLSKAKVDNLDGFSLLFDFLLTQIFTPKSMNNNVSVKETSEEYKQAVLECISTLFSAISFELLSEFYTQKEVVRMSVFLHTCMELLRKEKSKKLRLLTLECIMKCTQVDDSQDLEDVVLLNDIAQLFIKFLPGVASGLIVIAVDDQNCGHKIVQQCVKAWGRLVSILLRDYNPSNKVLKIEDLINNEVKDGDGDGCDESSKEKEEKQVIDQKLAMCANLLKKLAAYDHAGVRKQLVESCGLLCQTCFITLPQTIPTIIEIIVILSQDNYPEVSTIANTTLDDVISQLLNQSALINSKTLVDNLHECFHNHITNIPLIFNGVDTSNQLTAMSLLTGYLKLFTRTNTLKTVLFKQSNLDRLMGSLLCVAKIEKNASLLEEYTLHDWETTPDTRTPWKTFKHDKQVQGQITATCQLLAEPLIVDIVLDYLLEVYMNDNDRKAEATLLINELLSVENNSYWDKTKSVIYIYLDDQNWKLNLSVDDKNVLKDVQKNIIQICLQLEGLGKLALASGQKFQNLLLKVLYVVLEKAGCSHPMLQAAGLASIANISKACGYSSVTELINHNADYFAYNVTNKLRRSTENPSVLNVLAVVMQYTDMDVLPSISDIIEGVLMQSCDRFQENNAFAYLQVFAIFTKSMHKWLKIEVVIEPVVTKQQKMELLEAERRLHWEELSKPVDLSDEIMGKSAEELYAEDVRKRQDEEDEELQEGEQECKKPAPPKHIQLIVKILERSLNFLPAKAANCKILVLEVLIAGVEILKDFEDELLPIVHKIWSPLVNRFKEIDTPLIVNRSFSLLSTLGRLSKDFIRMRTVKELLPTINDILLKQSKESYLKDRGAAYRYTQGYKMQLNILGGLPRLYYDLELDDKISIVYPGIEIYLSSKQPAPLLELAVDFFRQVAIYDPTLWQPYYRKPMYKIRNT